MSTAVGAIRTVGETVGATVGGVAGGFAGAAVGSVFGPVGIVAGRFVGARVGQWGKRIAGGYLASKMKKANDKAEPEKKDDAKAITKRRMRKIAKKPLRSGPNILLTIQSSFRGRTKKTWSSNLTKILNKMQAGTKSLLARSLNQNIHLQVAIKKSEQMMYTPAV